MTLDAQETVIAANGNVFIAPFGTTLPTDAEAELDAEFKDLGYISEDGVTFTPQVESDGLPAWQSLSPIRMFLTEYSIEVAFECLQWNADTLPLYFGGGTFTPGVDGAWTFLMPKPGELVELSMVIEGVDGTRSYRIVLDKVSLSDAGDLTFLRSDAAKLPVTVTSLAGTTEGRPGAIYATDSAAA